MNPFMFGFGPPPLLVKMKPKLKSDAFTISSLEDDLECVLMLLTSRASEAATLFVHELREQIRKVDASGTTVEEKSILGYAHRGMELLQAKGWATKSPQAEDYYNEVETLASRYELAKADLRYANETVSVLRADIQKRNADDHARAEAERKKKTAQRKRRARK